MSRRLLSNTDHSWYKLPFALIPAWIMNALETIRQLWTWACYDGNCGAGERKETSRPYQPWNAHIWSSSWERRNVNVYSLKPLCAAETNHTYSIPWLFRPSSPFCYFLEVCFYETSRVRTWIPQPFSGPLFSTMPSSFPSSAHQTCSSWSYCRAGPWGCSSQQFCLLRYGRTSCLSDSPRWCHGSMPSPLPQHNILQERCHQNHY